MNSHNNNSSNNRQRQAGRIRKRSLANKMILKKALVAVSFLSSPSEAFVGRPLISGTSTASSSIPSALRLVTRNGNPEAQPPRAQPPQAQQQPKRLSRDQERELLRKTAELRRLKAFQQELALTHKNKQQPLLLLHKAQHAGYGTDLEAYEQAWENGHKAREALVTSNMGLVHFCVDEIVGKQYGPKRKRLNSLSRDDLVQEGAIGLARAVDKFDLSMFDTKLSSYAVYWIRAAVLRCIAERDDVVRVPQHVTTAISKVTAAASRLGLVADDYYMEYDDPSASPMWKQAQAAKQLAHEAGLTTKQLQQAMQVKERRNMGGYVSFEAWMQKGQDFESDVPASDSADNHRGIDTEHLVSTLSRFLRPKEMEALSWRYGLQQQPPVYRDYLAKAEEELFGSASTAITNTADSSAFKQPTKGKWGEAMSFTEVGKQMSISAEYGRRLCHKALQKLQQAAAEGQLEPALLF